MSHPRIAVLLDENTSSGGTRYEAHKGYFHHLIELGAAPFGIPYDVRVVGGVLDAFDGLLTAGGRFAFPGQWYVAPPAPGIETQRLAVEQALVEGFLRRDRPVLGICAGMQTLACMHGARLTDRVDGHDGGLAHPVRTTPGSRLAALVGPEIVVNSYHREAIVELPPGIVAGGRSPDGTIEAIELPSHRFAIGVQWHPELLPADHGSSAVFAGFVQASRGA